MLHQDFKIGDYFYCGNTKWLCTDIGTRTITAISIDKGRDKSWYNGPPYAVKEDTFDEEDIKGCTL